MVCLEFFNLGGNIFLKLMVRTFDIFLASGSEILISLSIYFFGFGWKGVRLLFLFLFMISDLIF